MSVVLHLTLVAGGPSAPDQRARSLSEGILRIGREPDNDWVLEDEARLISRHHCTITAQAGLFTLIDTSNNGVFVNDGERPLGRGNSVILSAGDRLHLGELTLEAAMTSRLDETDAFAALLPPSAAPDRFGMVPADTSAQRIPPLVQAPASPKAAAPPSLMAPIRRSSSSLFDGLDGSGTGESAPAGRLGDWQPDLGGAWSPPRQRFADLPVEPLETPGTPPDHLPVEEEALPPMRVSPQKIPDDWDPALDTATGDEVLGGSLMGGSLAEESEAAIPASWRLSSAPTDASAARRPEAAAPQPAPLFAAPSLAAPDPLVLACIEALALIEDAAAPHGQPRMLAGPPAEVRARLAQEDPEWVALLLVGLSADVAARLSHGPRPQRDAFESLLPLPARGDTPARDPGDSSQ